MARRHGKGKGPQQGERPAGQRPGGGGGGGGQQGGWTSTRDAIKRDVQQAVAALAFSERLAEKLDNQRRLYQDFPRVLESLRSGSMERLAAALGRIYDDGRGQSVDVQKFLRELPLATAHLASRERPHGPPKGDKGEKGAAEPSSAKEASAGQAGQSPPSEPPPASPAGPALDQHTAAADVVASVAGKPEAAQEEKPTAETAAGEASGGAAAEGASDQAASDQAASGQVASEQAASEQAASEQATASQGGAAPAGAGSAEGAPSGAEAPVPSPRLELRSRLLAAAPQLAKAAVSYRRNVATVRRACSPRRGPGPWRSDREVLEEARRAVEFVQKMYDAYADAWADQPLEKDAAGAVSAEVDRWLAWTQLDRYAELASSGAGQQKPREQREGRREVPGPKSQPPPAEGATQATPMPAPESAEGAVSEPSGGGAPAAEAHAAETSAPDAG